MDWLPSLYTLNEHDGDWDDYIAAIYAIFQRDFCGNQRFYGDRPVRLKRHPIEFGKEATFWHFISSGPIEDERDIDLRRAEHIAWPLAFIDNANDPDMKIWTETKNGKSNIHLWHEGASYLFVLSDRTNFVLPWTGYPIEHAHQRKKLNRRWEQFRA